MSANAKSERALSHLPPAVLVMMAALIVAVGLTWGPAGIVRYTAVFALLWVLPGINWALCMGGDGMTRAALGLGLAFVCTGLGTLLLHSIPGPFPGTAARIGYAFLALIPLLWRLRSGLAVPAQAPGNELRDRRDTSQKRETLSVPIVLVLVLVALLARIPNLGYSEFQGDEAVIMQRAAQALSGDDEELFLHQKGPVEILTPMALWALSGTLNEWQARLPFALMGVMAVVAVALLATRWFDARVGALTGFLLAINGLLVAFGRIVQYQNIVVAMGALGLLCLTEYAMRGHLRLLLLSAGFAAYGMLAHYDAVLIGPAALYLLLSGVMAQRLAWHQVLWHIVFAALVGVVILGVFYVPFMLNPMFSRTFTYLSAGRLGGDGWFHNSMPSVWVMSVFYTSIYYVVGLGVLSLVGACLTLLRISAVPKPPERYAALLYFVTPFVFYTFVVIDPRTHIYTFFPGAAMLAGMVLVVLWEVLRKLHRTIIYVGLALVGAWYALCAAYIPLAFVSHRPEYKRALPESRHPLYPLPAELPLYGYFGFPYRAGWKAVGALYAQGVLQGTYASNEEPEVTTWYVRSGPGGVPWRTMCGQPDLYIVAEHVQDEIAIDWDALSRDYARAFHVTVLGQPKLAVYRRKPRAVAPYTMDVLDYVRAFDATTTVDEQVRKGYSGTYPVGVDFGEVGRLLGYDISETQVRRGGRLRLTLYWQALNSPEFNHQVFVHLVAGERLIAQHDGAPACAFAPTSLWERGELVRDEHTLEIPVDAVIGDAQVYVGMYDLLTLARLPVVGTADNAVLLRPVDILR